MAAAFEALEKIGAAEADKALAGAREVGHHFGFLLRGRHIERGLEIVGEAVAWQVQHANGVHDLVGIEPGVLVVRVLVADAEGEGLRLALGEVEPAAAFQNEEAAVLFGFRALALGALLLCGRDDGSAGRAFREGVVALNEAAGAANHEQAHEFAPVVGVSAFFEGRQAVDRALVAAGKFVRAAVAVAPEIFLWPDADNIVWTHEQAELVGEVEVGFVVGRG